MAERLTNLAAVKEWLNILPGDTTSDSLLLKLINSASQFILNYLNRDSFQGMSYSQNFSGNGKATVLLRTWPILAVTTVGIGGTLVPQATIDDTGNVVSPGWQLCDYRQGPMSISLWGYYFGAYGDYTFFRNAPCRINYRAGFEVTDISTLTSATPPDPTIIYAPQSGGCWSADQGVVIGGVPATLVTGTPAAGQYAVDMWGTYTFSNDDASLSLAITYSYTPWDVSFATTELIGEWYRRKDRIGVLSKTLGGQETVSFSITDMTDSIRDALQLYMNVVPI